MAYDRFDPRYDRRETSHSGRDRWNEESRWRGRDEGDDRGFFERAGDEIASWFGDGDADRRERHPMQDSNEWDDGRSRRRPTSRTLNNDDGRYAYRSTGEYGARRPAGSFDRSVSDYRQRTEHRETGRQGRASDPHYMSWRQRQLDELDRDYDEFHRENQARFESEFGSWRQNRQQKRSMLGSVREHMEVVGSDNEHVGTVDRVSGDRLVLTKSDPESGGRHHMIGCKNIDRIEDDKIILDCTRDQAEKAWRDDGRSRALFEREDQGSDGPHILERSFEGTYR